MNTPYDAEWLEYDDEKKALSERGNARAEALPEPHAPRSESACLKRIGRSFCFRPAGHDGPCRPFA